MIVDPRPTLLVYPYPISIDEALPIVAVPLSGQDVLEFDLDAVYQQTVQEAVYGYDINYADLPRHFERYSAADQAKIVRRMLAVLAADQRGADMEQGPFAIADPTLSLADGLQQLKEMT